MEVAAYDVRSEPLESEQLLTGQAMVDCLQPTVGRIGLLAQHEAEQNFSKQTILCHHLRRKMFIPLSGVSMRPKLRYFLCSIAS